MSMPLRIANGAVAIADGDDLDAALASSWQATEPTLPKPWTTAVASLGVDVQLLAALRMMQ